jgi:HK97 family phage major capsid protein
MLPMLQRRVEKIQEQTWMTNIKNNATVGYTTAANNAITYADWLAFEHSLPAAYREDAAFILSDSCYQQVRGIKDSNGRPIFDTDPTNTFMGTIHGKPIVVTDYLDVVAPSGSIGMFASASALYVFDAGPQRLARYILQPAWPDQTGFELYKNGDFDWIDGGLRLLKMHT